MKAVNYQHLRYFWTVARLGTVTAASEELGLAQPTVSAQVHALEESLGHQLLRPAGRNLEVTDTGQLVFRYANDIFALGREMQVALEGHANEARSRLRVGVADAIPKMVAANVLAPAANGGQVRVVCYEGRPAELLGRLAIHELDMVISDEPAGPELNVRVFNHLVGECTVSLFAPKDKAEAYLKDFPRSVDRAPLLLPTSNTSMRRMLDSWFEARHIHPQVVAEFEDSALLKAFHCESGALFPAPTVVADDVEAMYNAARIGELTEVKERVYIITCERKVKHPAVLGLLEAAQGGFFARG